MEFTVHFHDQMIEAKLSGRLEFTDHDRLRDIVSIIGDKGSTRFILNLEGLQFIDSAGLGMILILQEEAEQRGVKLVVRRPQGDVRRSIDLAKIGEIVDIEY